MIFLCRRKISFVLETKFHPGEMRNVVTVLLATAIPAKDSIAPDTLFTCRVKEILMRLVGHVIAKETFVTELFRSSSTPFCFAVTDFCLRPPDYTLFRQFPFSGKSLSIQFAKRFTYWIAATGKNEQSTSPEKTNVLFAMPSVKKNAAANPLTPEQWFFRYSLLVPV